MKDKLNQESIPPLELRNAMRAWATGVAIVTGTHQNAVHGMTANSFNSIALDPPTVLVALQQHTRTRHLVKDGGVFGVTILDARQVKLARRFAGQIDTDRPRFEDVATFNMTTGAPLIEGGLAYLDCRVLQFFDVGNTTAFLGQVIASRLTDEDHRTPLLYFNQQWRKLDTA